MRNNTMHRGIAMIELIFAIVVMGIVMMSAPMLISTAAKSGYATIQQEGINEVASQINIILGYAWDESNTDDSRPPVILQTAGDSGLNEVIPTGRRAGTPTDSPRTFFDSNGSDWNASAIGKDGGDMDDMDDFNDNSTHLREINDTVVQVTTADYAEKEDDISISRSIGYIGDAASYLDPGADKKIIFAPNFPTVATGTSNIKKISVTLTSTSGVDELNKTITLHAFSCNIGAYILEER